MQRADIGLFVVNRDDDTQLLFLHLLRLGSAKLIMLRDFVPPDPVQRKKETRNRGGQGDQEKEQADHDRHPGLKVQDTGEIIKGKLPGSHAADRQREHGHDGGD